MKNFTLFKKVLYRFSLPLSKEIFLFCGLLLSCTTVTLSQTLPVKGIIAVAGLYNISPAGIPPGNETANHPLAVVFSQQPQAAIVCEGSDTSYTVVASGGGPLTYQWQVSINGGSTWNDVTNGGVYSGASDATLFITSTPFSMDAYQYRCNVSDGVVNTSNAVLLTVNPAPIVQTGNVGATICANGGGSLTAAVYANTSYQWQVSTDLGSNWTDVTDGLSYSGSATDALVISNAATFDGYLYRYRATNTITGCTATSTGVDTLHVTYITTSSLPPNSTITCAGTNTSMSIVASGNGTLTYQWRTFPGNVIITDDATFSGTTTATLNFTNPGTGLNNTRYRVFISNNGTCTEPFGPYTLQVRALTVINTQPQNDSTCATGNASFSVSAVGSGVTYQWQTDNGTGGSSWSNVATGNPLNLTGVTMAMNGYRYRVNVNGNCGNVASSEATLTVRSSGTWLGAVDTNWHVAGNWCGGVPVSTTDVLIPDWAPRMPTISNTTGTAYFQSLAIESNARLEINGGTIDNMSGPFDIQGTVAYTATVDQQVFPAPHGSLEINGSGNKSLLTNVSIADNMVLGGTAKLVTGTAILIMLNGSNPISGATFGGAVTSWIVTGNGSSGAPNTGLGGLRIEQLDASDGTVLYPVGPTSTNYNPIEFTNSGTADNFTIAVNDQRIPGSLYLFGIDRTWLVSESTPGGSNVALNMRWGAGVEQSDFTRAASEVVRSDGSSIVQNSATGAASGSDPYSRGEGAFTILTQFSVASFIIALPVKLIAFNAKKVNTAVEINWSVDKLYIAKHYTVQKSPDGIHFSDIGQVTGESMKTVYRFIDDNPGNAVTFYRLKMTGNGGEIAFSHVAQVTNNDATGVRVVLRPSVTTGLTGLFIAAAQPGKVVLTITDVMGRIQLKQTATVQAGEQVIPLNIVKLKSGMYYLHIKGERGMYKILTVLRQ